MRPFRAYSLGAPDNLKKQGLRDYLTCCLMLEHLAMYDIAFFDGLLGALTGIYAASSTQLASLHHCR